MKRLFTLIGAILLAFILLGCKNSIGVPQNVSLSGETLTWDEVDKADGYLVVVGSISYKTTETTLDLTTLALSVGNYSIGVKATLKDIESKLSNTVNYEVKSETVGRPTNLVLTNKTLSWQEVYGATSYVVTAGNKTITVTTTSLNLDEFKLEVGTHDVSVKALKGNIESQNSVSIKFTVTKELSNTVKLEMLKRFDNRFELDKQESDFPNRSEYLYYYSFVEGLDAYLNVAAENNLSEYETINVFHAVLNLTEMEDPTNIQEILDTFDSLLESGLTANVLSNALYEVSLIRNKYIPYAGMEDVFQGYIEEANQDYLDAISNIISIFNDLESFATETQKDALNQLLYNDELYRKYYTDVYSYVFDLYKQILRGDEYLYNSYIYDEEPYLIDNIFELFKKIANDGEPLQNIVYDALYDLANYYPVNFYRERKINEIDRYRNYQEKLITQQQTLEFLTENKELIINAYIEVFEFLEITRSILGKDGIVTILENLIEHGNITIEEILILKDELVILMNHLLPSEASFELVFEMIVQTAFEFNGTQIPFDFDFSVLSQASVLTFEIIIEFIDKVDEEYITGLYNLLDDNVSYSVLLSNVFMYTVDYFEASFEDIKAEYELVFTNEVLEATYQQLLNTIIDVLEQDEQYADIVEGLRYLLTKYDVFSNVVELFDGSFVPLLKLAQQVVTFSTSSELAENAMFTSIDLLFDLSNILIKDFDENSANAILDFLHTYLEFSYIATSTPELEPVLLAFDEERSNLVEVLLNVSQVVKNIELKKDEVAEEDFINNPNLSKGSYKDEQYQFLFYYITILKDANIKLLIDNTINLIADEILANDNILILIDDNSFIESYKLEALEMVDYIFSVIDEFGALDYNNLTEEEWALAEEFVDYLFGNPVILYDFDSAEEVVLDFSEGPVILNIDLSDRDYVVYKISYDEFYAVVTFVDLEGTPYFEVFSLNYLYAMEYQSFDETFAEIYFEENTKYVVFKNHYNVSYEVIIDTSRDYFAYEQDLTLDGSDNKIEINFAHRIPVVYKLQIEKPGAYRIYSHSYSYPSLEVHRGTSLSEYLYFRNSGEGNNFDDIHVFDGSTEYYLFFYEEWYENYYVYIEYIESVLDNALDVEVDNHFTYEVDLHHEEWITFKFTFLASGMYEIFSSESEGIPRMKVYKDSDITNYEEFEMNHDNDYYNFRTHYYFHESEVVYISIGTHGTYEANGTYQFNIIKND